MSALVTNISNKHFTFLTGIFKWGKAIELSKYKGRKWICIYFHLFRKVAWLVSRYHGYFQLMLCQMPFFCQLLDYNKLSTSIFPVIK